MVMSSETTIYNLALNAIGARSNVASPDERSREAEVCKLWFTPVRDQVLAAAVWPEATRSEYLALLNERDFDVAWANTNARPEYAYAYAVPSDMLHPQYLSDFSRFLLTSYPDDQRVLVTNKEDAILVYTSRMDTVSAWSSTLQMAVVYGLAAHIVMPLTGKAARAKMLAEKANDIMWAARERAANTSSEQYETLPDWIVQRGYGGAISPTRYMYPMGDVFASTANVN